jgi:hypothetical protein
MADTPTQPQQSTQPNVNGPTGGIVWSKVLQLFAMSGNDLDFVSCLQQTIADEGVSCLFDPVVQERCALLKATSAVLYQGQVLELVVTALPGRWRDWDQDIDDLATQTPYDPFAFTDATAILHAKPVPKRWLLPGLIADGLTLLGGSPKSGKSYLSYALALAVAKYGHWCNHWDVEQGKVIYVALEDDETDTRTRLDEFDPELTLKPGQLLFLHGEQAMPAFSSGALAWVEETLQMHHPRLLIIDPISYLYVLKKSGSQFEETKDMLFPLRWLGKKYGCAIVCPDHKRKRSRDDVSAFDTLYGSVAKQAVADGLLMVDRDDNEICIEAKIRNGKDQRIYLDFTFDAGRCFLTFKGGGDDKPGNLGELRQRVINVVQTAGHAMSIPEILATMELPETRELRNNLYQILFRLVQSREVEKTTRGHYIWSSREEK